MAPPLKKKSDANAPLVLPWHPNFRNFERLPDIKVVRTAFFVNLCSFGLVFAILSYVAYREYLASSIMRQVDAMQQQIQVDKPKSLEVVQQYNAFKQSSARIEEIDRFLKQSPELSAIILHVAKIMPRDVVFRAMEYRNREIILRGIVRGSADSATGVANAFIEQLKADAVLKKVLTEVTASNMNKSAQDQQLYFEFVLKTKTAQ